MPVIRVGRYCVRDGCSRPAQERSDLCAKCAHLARAFPSITAELEPLTELEVDLTISVGRERFHKEIWKWLERGAS